MYIFGELSGGYTQYPEDGSSNLFKEIQDQCVAPSQLIIHRDESMMYYVYIRKLDKNKYIGFAIVINGYYFTQLPPLFALFETEIEKMVESGVIIHLMNNGEIGSALSSLREEEEEVMATLNSLQTEVNKLGGLKKLPPVDFSIAIASRKIYKNTDPLSDVVNASYRFGYTIILKESDYDTVRLTSYKSVLKKLDAEKNALIKQNEDLKEYNKKIQRQRKQFKNVVFLGIIILACGIGLYFLNENLNDTQDRLDSANNTISEKDSIITDRNSVIKNLRDSVKSLKYDLRVEVKAKEKAEKTLQSLCMYSSFAVINCEVNAEQFKFDYFCLYDKVVTVTLKAINEKNNQTVSSTHTLTFDRGIGTKILNFSRRLNTNQYYYVVLICDGHIVAGRYW